MTNQLLSKNNTKGFIEAIECMEARGVDLKAFKVLLTINRYEGLGMFELAQNSKISSSAFSRYFIALSNTNQGRTPLVESKTDPVEYRKKALFMTKDGRKFIYEVSQLMQFKSQ